MNRILAIRTASSRLACRLGFGIALAALALAPACGDDEDEDDEEEKTPAELACEAVQDYVTSCGPATPCDDALVADCATVMGIVSDGYVEAVTTCIEAKKPPTACLGESLGALAPTAAHQALASKFCSECAFGVPGCESAFFSPDGGDDARLGLVLLPFGDDVVNEVAEQCASGLGCAATFVSCVQQVLAARAIPENTLQCLVDNLLNPQPVPPNTCGGGQGGATSSATSSASSSQMASSSVASSSSSSGGNNTLSCIDVSTIDPPCLNPNQGACACAGCMGICVLDPQNPATYSDCVCPECAADPYCSNAAGCQNDGVCDPFYEGCVCSDCANHPLCP